MAQEFYDDEILPWERDPDESPAAWGAFVTYRDMISEDSRGRRSLKRAAAKHYHGDFEYGVSAAKVRQFEKWSSAYDWQVRVEAWDAEQDRIKRQTHLATVEAMAERHAKDAAALQQIATLPSRLLAGQFKEMGEDQMLLTLNDLHLKDRIRLAYLGMRQVPRLQAAERLARGEPTEIVSGEIHVEGEEHLHGIAVVKRLLDSEEGIEALDAIGRLGLPSGEVVDVELEDDGTD